jgi:hypothetical protein
MVSRGLYRHYKGHAYWVYGVACDPHQAYRRSVVYSSVKTEEQGTPGQPRYDFLARDEAEFEEWVLERDPEVRRLPPRDETEAAALTAAGYVPRFARVVDPEASRLT